jgi:hypothetical protein
MRFFFAKFFARLVGNTCLYNGNSYWYVKLGFGANMIVLRRYDLKLKKSIQSSSTTVLYSSSTSSHALSNFASWPKNSVISFWIKEELHDQALTG